MKLYKEKEFKKTPKYWDKKLQLIDNKDLRNWCGAVIWWYSLKDLDKFDSVYSHKENQFVPKEFIGQKSLCSSLWDKWLNFHNKYVENYNRDHKFKRIDLFNALRYIGYKYQICLNNKY